MVGPKWPSLASLLSLTSEEIDEVKTEGEGQSQQVQALSMLKKWTSKEGASSTYDQLSWKLRKISLFQYSSTNSFKPSVRILKRLPRGSRECAAWKLTSILDSVLADINDISAWSRLLHFSSKCFQQPRRDGHNKSLATQVNHCIKNERAHSHPISLPHFSRKKSPMDNLTTQVSLKLEEGDFRGAVRIASSDESLADFSEETLAALKAKHSPSDASYTLPDTPVDVVDSFIPVSSHEVVRAIRSFPNGSSGGPDGLRPQHLKDMIGPGSGEGGVALIKALASFISLILLGKTPDHIRPFFFGASLIALSQKSGGVRSIAVGCSLRRLAAKCAVFRVKESLSSLLAPFQLGFGVSNGAESAAHAARLYLNNLPSEHLLLKLNFENAFNSLSRNKMFWAVHDIAPQVLPLVLSAYSSPSSLFFGDFVIDSCEGVQQGDPLGPLLFCLTINPIVPELNSEFRLLYLDDATLGGSLDDIVHDFKRISKFAANLGLHPIRSKSEVICKDHSTLEALLIEIPGLSVVHPDFATLLGSPIGSREGVDKEIKIQLEALRTMGERLRHLRTHDAFSLLRHAFSIPKLLYILRSSPCFSSSSLFNFDELQRALLSEILNITLSDNAWIQASLPVRSGGLGIRRAEQLAPSAFLASATACSDLIKQILPAGLCDLNYDLLSSALRAWSHGHDNPPSTVSDSFEQNDNPPPIPDSFEQKSWDNHLVQASLNHLLHTCDSDQSRARLLAATEKESGAWLDALPVSSLGLRLDDDTIRIAVGLRLGVPLVLPHPCSHCGSPVDVLATHGLSCRKSQGRHLRHSPINALIKRSLTSAKIPSIQEPCEINGKRPDGVTQCPWKRGRILVWDLTCPDTFSSSHVSLAACGAGNVADEAEYQKKIEYSNLGDQYLFVPLAVETSGAFGQAAVSFFRDLGRRIRDSTGENRSSFYLTQRLAVEIQRGNAAAVLGTLQ